MEPIKSLVLMKTASHSVISGASKRRPESGKCIAPDLTHVWIDGPTSPRGLVPKATGTRRQSDVKWDKWNLMGVLERTEFLSYIASRRSCFVSIFFRGGWEREKWRGLWQNLVAAFVDDGGKQIASRLRFAVDGGRNCESPGASLLLYRYFLCRPTPPEIRTHGLAKQEAGFFESTRIFTVTGFDRGPVLLLKFYARLRSSKSWL